MARAALRFVRGTAAQVAAYTGPAGEPVFNIDQKRVHVQDGVTPGGVPLLAAGDSAGLAGLRGTLWGLTMFNNGTDAANDIDIAPGSARDSANAYDLTLASGLTKRLDAVWAVGLNAGGLDTGAKAASTTYHIHLIRRASDSLIDAIFSTSATSPTMPSGWTARRRIGAVLTDGSGAIRPFRQVGGWFHFKGATTLDYSGVASGPTPALRTLSLPKGVKVLADLSIVSLGTSFSYVFAKDPDLGVPTTSGNNYGASNYRPGTATHFFPQVWTNTAGQIYTADTEASSATLYIGVLGWFDPRDEYL